MLTLIIARLRDQVPALRQVAGAADLAAADNDLKRVPAAYVLPLRERAGANYLELGVSQRVARTFGVLLGTTNLRDARGESAYGELDTLRQAVRGALLNWEPDGDHEPCEFVSGQLFRLTDGVLWWQDEFMTAHLVRQL